MLRLSFRRRRTEWAAGQTTGRRPGDDTPGQDLDARATELDRYRAAAFAMPPAPEPGTVLQEVDQLTLSLSGAIDEGSDKTLDLLITSWTGGWIAAVDSEYLEHCADINRQRGQAQELLTEATVTAQYEEEKLDRIRSDYAASRHRLTGEHHEYTQPAATAVTSLVRRMDNGQEPAVPATVTPLPGPAPRQDWSEPHLVAGRGKMTLIAGAILVVIGATADTIAFHNVLELVLSTEAAWSAWALAAGATSMALVVAAFLGVARANHRRGRYLAPRHRPSRLPVIAPAVVWLGMGAAMFLIRWKGNIVTVGFTVAKTAAPAHNPSTVWQALFFLGIYLISGVCTIFEAERLFNPEYMAYMRLGKALNSQAKIVARAEARRMRAQAAVDRFDEELRDEEKKKAAAIAQRKWLGTEAAHYARVRMAAIMGDPAKTGITETGPRPDLPAPFGPDPAQLGAGPAAATAP
jgi:hypothetical protein